MKKIFIVTGLFLSILFQSCHSQMKEPNQDDFSGTWKSAENAELIFAHDGTFTGKLIPGELGFFPADSFKNVKFSGSGKWGLKKGSVNWEINLDFDKVSVPNKNGCEFPLLIANKNGTWYLFAWKEEEGGERYSFIKQ